MASTVRCKPQCKRLRSVRVRAEKLFQILTVSESGLQLVRHDKLQGGQLISGGRKRTVTDIVDRPVAGSTRQCCPRDRQGLQAHASSFLAGQRCGLKPV
eukprot:2550655-Amphidinium_carterae.1